MVACQVVKVKWPEVAAEGARLSRKELMPSVEFVEGIRERMEVGVA